MADHFPEREIPGTDTDTEHLGKKQGKVRKSKKPVSISMFSIDPGFIILFWGGAIPASLLKRKTRLRRKAWALACIPVLQCTLRKGLLVPSLSDLLDRTGWWIRFPAFEQAWPYRASFFWIICSKGFSFFNLASSFTSSGSSSFACGISSSSRGFRTWQWQVNNLSPLLYLYRKVNISH